MNRFLTRPLYLQLRDALIERVASGQWQAGTMVPNEVDLAREFGVSPGTMRKALDLMEAMRLVTRRQGRGTFVNDLSSQELAARHTNLRTADGGRIYDQISAGAVTEAIAGDIERSRLRLDRAVPVFRFQRRRMREGRTYMVEDVSVPAALFPRLAEEQESSALITTVALRHGILLGRAEERISLGSAPPEVAEAVGIAPAAPVMMLDRVVFTMDGRAAEWRMAWCHLDDGHYFAVIG